MRRERLGESRRRFLVLKRWEKRSKLKENSDEEDTDEDGRWFPLIPPPTFFFLPFFPPAATLILNPLFPLRDPTPPREPLRPRPQGFLQG